ncbi:MAG: hypothetical protein WBC91_13585 [Phototrophicaceae bacterium]
MSYKVVNNQEFVILDLLGDVGDKQLQTALHEVIDYPSRNLVIDVRGTSHLPKLNFKILSNHIENISIIIDDANRMNLSMLIDQYTISFAQNLGDVLNGIKV